MSQFNSTSTLNPLQKIAGCRILVVGDLMLDVYRIAAAARISPEAPVPVLLNPHTEYRLGGAAAVAAMCARLGSEVAVIGVTGQDRPGEQIYELLNGWGVTSLAVVDPSRPTTVKERICGVASGRHRQQLARIDTESTTEINANLSARVGGIIAEAAPNIGFDAIIIADYAKGVCTDRIVQACRNTGSPVFVDPPKGVDWPKYFGMECVVPNREEAGGKTAHLLCRQLQCAAAVVKLDQDGCKFQTRETSGIHSGYHIKGTNRAVHDVTGAGDQFVATLACCRAAGADWLTAARLANAAAGLQVERHGCVPVTTEEISQEMGYGTSANGSPANSPVNSPSHRRFCKRMLRRVAPRPRVAPTDGGESL